MSIDKLVLKNFTVFDKLDIEFSEGINVLIGTNGKGKTHILKILYSACQASNKKISFGQKIVGCFGTDDHKISRLCRRKQGGQDSSVRVFAHNSEQNERKTLSAKFSTKTQGSNAEVTGKEGWEKTFGTSVSSFIPAKEILSNAYNLNAAAEKNNVFFDDTYLDIVNSAKVDISVGANTKSKNELLKQIEEIINGKVSFDSKRDEFYLKQGSSKIEFNLVAEGIRKIALVWQLVKNGTLDKGSVLLWDEPESNINPMHIPVIVDLLYALQRNGVQIFIATHDYILAKYLEIRSQKTDNISFYSFYDENCSITCEKSNKFTGLKNNIITESFDKLLDEVYDNSKGL